MLPAIKKAQDAGIKVITVDIPAEGIEVLSYVGTDNYKGGEKAGELMAKVLNNKGEVAIINYPTVQSVVSRIDGFKKALESHPDVKIVAEQTGITRAEALAAALGVHLIGRARREKRIIDQDYITETFRVGGRDYHYRQYENSFSQPNAAVCQHMLDWATAQAGSRADLLELYCGNGNFTLPLAARYRRVLATEVSKSGIRALRANLSENNIENIAVARLSAEELGEALRGVRPFRRLQQDGINLATYDFDTVFVDPPRAGIDAATLALIARYPRILYISCNPETLAANLHTLSQTHRIRACALFDQFPFTPHIESGVVLVRK